MNCLWFFIKETSHCIILQLSEPITYEKMTSTIIKHYEASRMGIIHHGPSWNIISRHYRLPYWNRMNHHEPIRSIVCHQHLSFIIMSHQETSRTVIIHQTTCFNQYKRSYAIIYHHEPIHLDYIVVIILILKYHEPSWTIFHLHEPSFTSRNHCQTSWTNISQPFSEVTCRNEWCWKCADANGLKHPSDLPNGNATDGQ